MPTYTAELWRVLDLKPASMTEDEWIGLNEYELFEGIDRDALNAKIKNHFMYQEIGHETVDQFRFAMRRKMNEIMPVYNELYSTLKVQYDPLSTIDMRTVSKGTQDQATEATSSNETDSDIGSVAKTVASSYPGVMLSGDKDYATNGSDSNSQTKTVGKIAEVSSAENKTESDNDSHTTGYQGIPAQLIQAYRSAIINVDMMIVSELDELFMMVWNNADSYTTNKGRFFL